jgi:hypothetical protein
VIDITKPERPEVVNQVPLENLTMVSFGLAMFETPKNSATWVLPSEMETRKALPEAVFWSRFAYSM